jgi:hypothetical protein
MAIHKPNRGNGGTAINVRYNALLGGLYVSTPEVEKQLADIRAEVCGSDAPAFTGYGNNSTTQQAANKARDLGIDTGIRVEGEITSAFIRKVEGDYEYLVVGLRDGDERVYVSTAFGMANTQLLIRKLQNVEPGERVTINMWGTYEPGQTDPSRSFSNHHASLKDADGNEIQGINPQEALQPQIDAAIQKLLDAGVDDKETLAARREKLTNDWHRSLSEETNKRFIAWAEARQAQAQTADAPGAPAADTPFGDGGAAADAAAAEAEAAARQEAGEPDAAAVAGASRPRARRTSSPVVR